MYICDCDAFILDLCTSVYVCTTTSTQIYLTGLVANCFLSFSSDRSQNEQGVEEVTIVESKVSSTFFIKET